VSVTEQCQGQQSFQEIYIKWACPDIGEWLIVKIICKLFCLLA